MKTLALILSTGLAFSAAAQDLSDVQERNWRNEQNTFMHQQRWREDRNLYQQDRANRIREQQLYEQKLQDGTLTLPEIVDYYR